MTIVRLFTSVASHLVRNMTERPSDMHPSVKDWTIALTLKGASEFGSWLDVAQGLSKLGLRVIPALRLEPSSIAPWVGDASWRASLGTAHAMMDALDSDTFAPDVEAYAAKSTRSPSDIPIEHRDAVRAHCERFARRLGARRVYVGPSSADCLLTRAFAADGVDTIGVIQGISQGLAGASLFGHASKLDWYHERALRLHQEIPGARAMPQLYASALRAHADPLPSTISEAWVYVGASAHFSRATEPEIGTKAWHAYETDNPINIGCSWYGPRHPGKDVLSRGNSYTVIVRRDGGGPEAAIADRPNLRSWTQLGREILIGDAVVGAFSASPRVLCVRSDPVAGTAFHAFDGGKIETISIKSATEQAGHIYAPGATSIETWGRPLTHAEIEVAMQFAYPRVKG